MPTSPPATTKTLIELLSHLIRMPTVSGDHATNRGGLDWIEAQLHGLPLNFKHLSHNGVPSLIATTPAVKDGKNPRLWLAGHLDVVPAPPAEFAPRVKNDRLIGRGVYDMKFAIAGFIALLAELGPDLKNYSLGLMITTDEEHGGLDGTGRLVADGYRGEAAIIPDGGFNWELESSAKGVAWWELTATGQSTHASTNWRGTNALDRLVDFIRDVQSNAVPEPCGDPSHAHHTITLTKISGGSAANQVPDSATAEMDFRLAPGQSHEIIRGWMRQSTAAVPGVEARERVSADPYTVSQDGAVSLFRRLAMELTGHDLPNVMSNGASDARFFAAHKIPVVSVRPTGGNPHGAGEWIGLVDFAKYYEITRRFVREWCKAK